MSKAVESYKLELENAAGKDRLKPLLRLAHALNFSQPEDALEYSKEALKLSEDFNLRRDEGEALLNIGDYYLNTSDYKEALRYYLQALRIIEEYAPNDVFKTAILKNIGLVFFYYGDLNEALRYYYMALKVVEEHNDEKMQSMIYNNLGGVYKNMGNDDKARECFLKGLELKKKHGANLQMATSYGSLGVLEKEANNLNEALEHFNKGLQYAEKYGDQISAALCYLHIADVYLSRQEYEMAVDNCGKAEAVIEKQNLRLEAIQLYETYAKTYKEQNNYTVAEAYLEKALNIAREIRAKTQIKSVYDEFSKLYQKQGDYEKAYRYLKLYTEAKDQMLNEQTMMQVSIQQTLFETEKKEREAEIYRLKNVELKEAVDELKRTQDQLVAQERLATIGQLSAGIAHEIQNPLNFVNNFGTLNLELIEEITEDILEDEKLSDGEKIEELKEVLQDLCNNADKIIEHGKRADRIIKQMLLHSRGRVQEKKLININETLKDNLQLAYHGTRAKYAEFNSDIIEKYDPTNPDVLVVPQDISRVFLNLLSNAFYAIYKKSQKTDEEYAPSLVVSTELKESKLIITIEDNGIGIPSEKLEKIFEPFFTTKPTGEGTGLGLSISKDVIEKVHGGNISVRSLEGAYTKFIITLPM